MCAPWMVRGAFLKRWCWSKLVLSKLLAEGGNTVELNTENWQAGVYMYSISINGQVQEFRKMILIRQ